MVPCCDSDADRNIQTPEQIAAKLETSKRTRVRSRQLLDMYHNQFDPAPPESEDDVFTDDVAEVGPPVRACSAGCRRTLNTINAVGRAERDCGHGVQDDGGEVDDDVRGSLEEIAPGFRAPTNGSH